jgi:selenium-binding protein 1
MGMRPDPTFHASPKLAMDAPAEGFAYTLLLSPDFSRPDALAVIDVQPGSPTYSQVVHTVPVPNKGDEFHHFGWNACSSSLSPLTGHAFLERRYLIIPGMRSSRIYIVDTKPHPTQARIHKIIEPEEIFRKTGYSRPHTVHCGPEGIYVSTLGGAGPDGTDGPPGIFIMDCETFEVLGRWEIDRGPQQKHYDFWWNLPRDYMVSSEWALPPQFENGIVPEDLLSNKYGHHLHFWDLRARRNVQTIDLGANHQMALEVRPAHDPSREYGFVGVVVDTTNLEGSIWTWWREGGQFHIEKTATIPAEPAATELLPPLLQGFGAVPPLVTDIDLSIDDKFLYVACWGTGEMRQYDVTEPHNPKLTGSVHIGGIARRTPHPNGERFAGGPQMVEISRDGKRVYWTNSLYSTWDNQFYPDGVPAAQVMAYAEPGGGLKLADDYWSPFPPAIARIRSGWKAEIARPIHSAIRRWAFDRQGLVAYRPLGGDSRKRSLSRHQSRDGMAAGRVERLVSTTGTGAVLRASLSRCGARARDVLGDAAVCVARGAARMATCDTGRRERAGHRLWCRPVDLAASSYAEANSAYTSRALVVRDCDCAWGRADAGADLSWTLPGVRHGSRAPGSTVVDRRQPRDGVVRFSRARCRDDDRRRISGVAGVSLSRT